MPVTSISFKCFFTPSVLQKLPRFASVLQVNRHIQRTSYVNNKKKETDELMIRSRYFELNKEDKSKDTFLAAINMYHKNVHRRAHVEFIYSALKHMEEFGVHRDLEAYKNILDVLPKGKMVPTNMFQAEFMHYPKQQQCAIDLLEQMEDNGVIPDGECEIMMRNIFGRHGFPFKKLLRMSYWMPKFKNSSPWALPDEIPTSNLDIAKLAVQRMCSVDPASQVEVFDTKELTDSIDETWIVSGQSPTQREILEKMKPNQTVYVEGAFTIWLRRTSINYFILRAEPVPVSKEEQAEYSQLDFDDVSQLKSWILGEEIPSKVDLMIKPSVHEQEDGNILAVAVTGNCSKDSLLSWIRFLERKNPHLGNLSVLFATNSPLGEVTPYLVSGEERALPSPTLKLPDNSTL